MDAINNITEAPLIGTCALSTGPTKDNIIHMLAVDFTLLLYFLKQLFGTRFRTLFLATLRWPYLLAGQSFIIRTFSIRNPSLLVENHQLDNDLLLALQHPALDTFFDFSPTIFIVNLNRQAVGNAHAF